MNTDFRALCAELIDALDGWHQAVFETGTGWVRPDETYLLDRARAALAAPDGPAVLEGREPASVVGDPSDKELLELMHKSMRDDLAEVSRLAALQAGTDPGVFRVCLNYDVAKFDRAVLARFGHHSPDATKMVGPAEGDVAELVAWLRGANWDSKRQTLATRAADLLEGLSSGWVVPIVEQFAPVPGGMIPVEYWDIDSGARIVTEPSEEGAGGCWVVLNSHHVNPLTEFPTAKAAWDALQQAHALPLPKGEVE